MNWNHIIFVDLLPIVLIVALFLIYRRMEVGLLNDRVKMFSDDATFWREKAWLMQGEWQRLKDEQLKAKNPSNAQVLPPAGVARLIADLESKDFENILDRQDEPAQNLPPEE
jgi:hypothetical protein